MEEDLNCWVKWKTTSIFWKNGRRPQYFGKMEDDLNCKINGRRPKYTGKGKTTAIRFQIEEIINLSSTVS